MPGSRLAKKIAEVYGTATKVLGLILIKHGIFSFGAEAREAYERMIELVSIAETRLSLNRKSVFVPASLPEAITAAVDVAPILRGAFSLKEERAEGAWRRLVLEFRTGQAVLNFVNGAELARYS